MPLSPPSQQGFVVWSLLPQLPFSLSVAQNQHDNPNFPINHTGSDSFKPFTSEKQQGVIFSARHSNR